MQATDFSEPNKRKIYGRGKPLPYFLLKNKFLCFFTYPLLFYNISLFRLTQKACNVIIKMTGYSINERRFSNESKTYFICTDYFIYAFYC